MVDVDEWLGDSPESVAKSLTDFSRSSELLSVDSSLVDRYAHKWIGVCSGKVMAAEDDLEALLDSLDTQGLPRNQTVVRFIEREQRTLIL